MKLVWFAQLVTRGRTRVWWEVWLDGRCIHMGTHDTLGSGDTNLCAVLARLDREAKAELLELEAARWEQASQAAQAGGAS